MDIKKKYDNNTDQMVEGLLQNTILEREFAIPQSKFNIIIFLQNHKDTLKQFFTNNPNSDESCQVFFVQDTSSEGKVLFKGNSFSVDLLDSLNSNNLEEDTNEPCVGTINTSLIFYKDREGDILL